MANLPLMVAAALTLAGSIALVATVAAIIPGIFRDHYRHELWRIAADLHRRAREGQVPRAQAIEFVRAIDRHAEVVTRLSGSDVLAYRIARRLAGAHYGHHGSQPFRYWESQLAFRPYVKQIDEVAAKALMYGSFSGWTFTLYMTARSKVSKRNGSRSRYRAAEAGARRAVRRLEDFGEVAKA